MGRNSGLAFLPDEDSLVFRSYVRDYRVLEYREVGLARGAPDHRVVEHARDHNAIVITRNKRDFLKVMRDAAVLSSHGDCKAMRCHEGGGLVTVHASLNAFHFRRVSQQLYLGGEKISWGEVYLLNLRVNIDAQQRVTVSVLPVCSDCLRRHTDGCERCADLRIMDLYASRGLFENVS